MTLRCLPARACLAGAALVLCTAFAAVSRADAVEVTVRILGRDVVEWAPLRRSALLIDSSGDARMVDVATGASTPWSCDWKHDGGGWKAASGFPGYVVSSPDGQWLCFHLPVEGLDYPGGEEGCYTAVIVCRADGSEPRMVNLRNICYALQSTRRFSDDSRYLIDEQFSTWGLKDAGYGSWLPQFDTASGHWSDSGLWIVNAYDVTTGRLLMLRGFDNDWDGEDASHYGDETIGAWEEQACFYDLVGHRFECLGCADQEIVGESFWIARDLKMSIPAHEGERFTIRTDGLVRPLPPGDWEVYCWLPGGRSIFSRDAGATLELGMIDWDTGAVPDASAPAALQQFARPWGAREGDQAYSGFYALPLQDGSGALFYDTSDGTLYVVAIGG